MEPSVLQVERPHEDAEPNSPATFNPTDRAKSQPVIQLPDELWVTILESPCTFPADIFFGVMLNLIKNPNITSSHLFRADIFYDSESDQTLAYSRGGQRESSLASHLKPEYRPLNYALPGYDLVRTIVRQLVPRNPQLDRPLVQTCHLFSRLDKREELNVVLYIPHVQEAQDMPFYHPEVSRLAFVHSWRQETPACSSTTSRSGSISISYCLFQDTTLTTKLERTALRLLQTVHKHGQGQLAGYEKRVHLDQIIPQKRYQDTYSRLKARYGKHMSEQWVEVTDPGKHVFEDIGIAAFLIELWQDMYTIFNVDMYTISNGVEQVGEENGSATVNKSKTTFPGFVDIGCGNGVLVYILAMEGYEGWGFDARERKTWHIFPEHIQKRLRRRLLVPDIFQTDLAGETERIWHNGFFEPGTFIISNHADELTVWTPLLAYLNHSTFLAIPCCSHGLAGARFRAPPLTKVSKGNLVRLPQQVDLNTANGTEARSEVKKPQVAETGSLKRTEAQKKVPSAYSTLCSYVASLAEEVGYRPEREVLRIPSTRNHCIIGRRRAEPIDGSSAEEADVGKQKVVDIVERELRTSVQAAGTEWIQRGEKLSKKPGSGH